MKPKPKMPYAPRRKKLPIALQRELRALPMDGLRGHAAVVVDAILDGRRGLFHDDIFVLVRLAFEEYVRRSGRVLHPAEPDHFVVEWATRQDSPQFELECLFCRVCLHTIRRGGSRRSGPSQWGEKWREPGTTRNYVQEQAANRHGEICAVRMLAGQIAVLPFNPTPTVDEHSTPPPGDTHPRPQLQLGREQPRHLDEDREQPWLLDGNCPLLWLQFHLRD